MPEKIGFLFPGQGAQQVGMGQDLFKEYPAARRVFEKADSQLGYALSRLCFEGPEEELTRTCYAQPAIFTVSMAVWAVLKERFPELTPHFVAGLSLGEFSAIAAAECLSFKNALALVKRRAEAMEKAAQVNPGTMASIVGLTEADCSAIAQEAGCELANLNTPDQFVLSGTPESIENACRLADSRGAKRAIPLKVGGAFHSSLMQTAKEDLEKALSDIPFRSPLCLFVPNASAQVTSDTKEIRALLARQLMSPVRWIETMERAEELGVRYFIEMGPGKVLKGLARRNQPGFSVESCGTSAEIRKLESLFAAA